VSETKSDRFRRLAKGGMSCADIATQTRSNYAFVYGVLSRAGLIADAASRRPVKRVVSTADYTDVRTDAGTVRVDHRTGKSTKVK
jgi:hypothetical protein